VLYRKRDMHFLPSKSVNQQPKDFAYWRDLALGALGAVSILACLGHTEDWIQHRNSADRNVALGFLMAYGVIALLAPNRYKYVFLSLVVIVAWGILGAISHATLIGYVVIVPCALLAFALLRWKGHLLK
jgi:hypothetical protein